MSSKQAQLERRYAPRDKSVLSRTVAEEIVIVDMQSGVYHGLNRVGAQIWERLDGEHSLAQIVDELSHRFTTVERSQIERDSLALVQSLLDNGLVTAR